VLEVVEELGGHDLECASEGAVSRLAVPGRSP